MKKIVSIVLLLVVVIAVVALQVVPAELERSLNKMAAHDPYAISEEAQALHETIPVVDLHTDSLLWKRDLNEWSDRGHVDVPRLQASNVAIQMFTAVTKSPEGQNYDSNSADSDTITMLVQLQLWPFKTWGSLFERAMFQAEKLEQFADASGGNLVFVKDRAGLEEVLKKRDSISDPRKKPVAALYGLEGAHPLEGELSNLYRLYDAGVRMLGITHFFDNDLAGSLHGLSGAGLTPLGKEVVQQASQMGMIIDVAHVSPKAVEEILELSARPVILSHGGMKGVCDTPRNLEDGLMQRIAQQGGLIGIGFWDGAVCDPSPAGVVKSIRYAIDLLGIDHVALGSDWDGTIEAQIDASELNAITQAMMDQGFSETEIRKVMGENAVAFFLKNLD